MLRNNLPTHEHMSCSTFFHGLLAAAFLAGSVSNCLSQGIPEPTMILYGVVTDPLGYSARISFGPLIWVFQPGDGSPAVTVTGVLTNINDQFSYVLRVPVETVIPGVSISPGTLKLASTPTVYDRSQVTVSGMPAFFVTPAQTNLVLTSTDRGRIERVDLTVNLNLDSLLPVAWQLQYFGHTGVSATDDPDHDGMNNLQEYLAGTNPLDSQSRFEVLRVTPDASGSTIEWSAVLGKTYSLQRSGDLLTGFVTISSGIPGTEPTTVYRDTTATGDGPFFYRVRVE